MERAGASFPGHGKNTGSSSGSKPSEMKENAPDTECIVREQDRFMPIANVIRIMRRVIPPHGKISDDAKETIQECVSEFISFVTGEANERCQREQRKTITAEDILFAMSKLGFDDFIEPITMFLTRYREVEGDRGNRTGDSLKRSISAEYRNLGASGFPHSYHPHMDAAHAHHHSAPPGLFFDPAAFGIMGGPSNENADVGEPPLPNDNE